jgi:hypothetical protein
MPVYEYRCVYCREADLRVAGLDDHTAICSRCGSLMLRLDEDIFEPYFDKQEELPEAGSLAGDGERLGKKRTRGHADGKPVLLRLAGKRAAGAGAAAPPAAFPKY